MVWVQATRERILDASISLFAERGFKATTMTDIETAAGLTPGAGAVFHHFATKRDLLAAAVEHRFQQLEALNQVRSVIPSLGDRRAELRLFARFLTDQIQEERELLALVLSEARTHTELFADAVRRLFADRERSFACWLAGLQPDADPAPADRARARIALGGLAYGATIDALLGRSTPDLDDDVIDAWVESTIVLLDR